MNTRQTETVILPHFEDKFPTEHYNMPTSEILNKYLSCGFETINDIYEQAALDLIQLVRNGTIWFPFQRYFRGNPDELFSNLKTINLEIKEGAYRLHSYYPKYGNYLPPKFRERSQVIVGTRGTYETADVLSDHYIEDVRLKAKRYDQIRSILQCWMEDSCLKEIFKTVLHKKYITPASLRDAIYETIPETKIFNPTWAIALLKLVMGNELSGKKWLDISAGWGDRLIAAMALDMDYVGFDPNIELKPGHTEMIKRFGNPNKHHIIYEPFEKAIIPEGPYDVILTSPPYFTIEEYAPEQEGQSIVSYPNFNQWMVKFLFTSLNKSWNNLKEGGYLILHLGDAKTIATSEAANIYIENYLLGASWEGVIGLQGEAGFPRPVWVWKKLPLTMKRNIWEPQSEKISFYQEKGPLKSNQRTLYYTYPELQNELIRLFASNYAPYYPIRKSSAQTVKKYISIRLPDIPYEIINTYFDDLMISSVLETQGTNNTINFFIDLIQPYPHISINNINSQVSKIAPYYIIRKSNAPVIRDNVTRHFPTINKEIINTILHDDLMISSLLEVLTVTDTIIWAIAMIKLSLHI
jgi:hypothetical protein